MLNLAIKLFSLIGAIDNDQVISYTRIKKSQKRYSFVLLKLLDFKKQKIYKLHAKFSSFKEDDCEKQNSTNAILKTRIKSHKRKKKKFYIY